MTQMAKQTRCALVTELPEFSLKISLRYERCGCFRLRNACLFF
jgi:hypothetical protein